MTPEVGSYPKNKDIMTAMYGVMLISVFSLFGTFKRPYSASAPRDRPANYAKPQTWRF